MFEEGSVPIRVQVEANREAEEFALTGRAAESGLASFWARGAVTCIDGRDGGTASTARWRAR